MKSQYVGDAIKNLQESGEVNGVAFAIETNTSTALVSAMKSNKRKMTPELAAYSMDKLDNAPYELELLNRFSNGKTAPRLNGDAVDTENHLAIGIRAIKELKEAMEVTDLTKLLCSPDKADERTQEYVSVLLKEWKEALVYGKNFVAVMSEQYNQSSKQLSEQVTRKLKAEGVLR